MEQQSAQKQEIIFLGTIFHHTNFLQNGMLIFNNFLYLVLLVILKFEIFIDLFQNMHHVSVYEMKYNNYQQFE